MAVDAFDLLLPIVACGEGNEVSAHWAETLEDPRVEGLLRAMAGDAEPVVLFQAVSNGRPGRESNDPRGQGRPQSPQEKLDPRSEQLPPSLQRFLSYFTSTSATSEKRIRPEGAKTPPGGSVHFPFSLCSFGSSVP